MWIDILGESYHYLIRIHPINGIVLTIFILSHIYLNRNWIKVQLLNKKL